MMNVKLNTRVLSGTMTLITTLIVITPLCGLLFQCGCDWPWFGLDAGCNYYKQHAAHKCPWCTSMLTGILSTGLAVMSGVFMAIFQVSSLTWGRPVIEVLMRTGSGVMMFICIAIISSGVAAVWQDYPIGLGQYLSVNR